MGSDCLNIKTFVGLIVTVPDGAGRRVTVSNWGVAQSSRHQRWTWIRATVELVSWLRASMRQTELLGSTLGVMCDVMIKSGEGEQPCYEIRMTLPCSTTDFTEKKWVSSGWPYLPNGVAPADPECEETIVASLLTEIKEKIAILTGLPTPPFRLAGRGVGEKRYFVVGASHAVRLAEALKKKGRRCSWWQSQAGE